MKKYGFAWATGAFFLVSLVGHWVFGWFAHVSDATEHLQAPAVRDYLIEMGRDTLENWPSEFLQLVWQVVGLTLLYYAGSPQSRGDDERIESKLDVILRKLAPGEAERLISSLDEQYPRK